MSQQQVNLKHTGVKRILSELREMKEHPSSQYTASPLEDNLYEWHFTIRGPPDTEFEGGRYHGRILLPPEYPFKPPSIILSTPNGRFETGKKICLSITGYHPEFWQPAWGIRTALLAIISFFPTKSEGAIGGLDWTPEERRTLATRYDFSSFFVPGILWLRSLSWSCAQCGVRMDTALPADSKDQSSADGGERKEPDSPSKSVDLSMFSFAYEKQATEEASSGSSSASTSVPKPVSSGNQGRDAGEIPTNTMAHSNRGEGSTVRQRPAALGAGVSGPSSVSASPARSPVSPTAVPREQTANMEAANRQRKIDAIIVFLAVIVGLLILRRFLAFLGPV